MLATQAAAKKKEYAENQKRTRAEEKHAHRVVVPKLTEENRRLENENKELNRTVVLLTQPAPRHSSNHEHEEMQFRKAHSTQLQAEKTEEKHEKQQAILQHAAKSVELLRKEEELKKVNAALKHVQLRNQAEIKEKEEERKNLKLKYTKY